MPSITRLLVFILVLIGLVYGGAFMITQMGKPDPTEIRVKVPHDRFDK